MLRRALLLLFYYMLHSLVRVWLWLYYREIRVEGFPQRMPRGPLILLSNHPNALMDPFLVVSRLYRQVFFLANASLFRHPFANWFLNTFYCIPVERPKDVDRPIDNAHSFRRSREHLEGGGALYIAPEGSCHREYRLRPLRTGTARIALDLLSSSRVQEVHFLMGGIVYADPPAFRSRLLLRFAPVFTLRREDLHGDITDWNHVAALTLRLRHIMESLLPHGSETQDVALGQAAALLRPALRRKHFAKRIDALRDHLHRLGDEAGPWTDGLRAILWEKRIRGLDPEWLSAGKPSSTRFWLTLPLTAAVLLHYPVMYGLPEWIRRRLGADPVYDATVRYMAGLLTLPLGIWLHWLVLRRWLDAAWVSVYILLIVVLGPLAWQEIMAWRDWRVRRRLRNVFREDPHWCQRLEEHLRTLSERWP